MNNILLLIFLVAGFSAQASDQLTRLQKAHRECIIQSGAKTYAKVKLNCGQRVDYDLTNQKIKEACDKAIEKRFTTPKSQSDLNLQRDFRSSVYSVSYAILSNIALQHKYDYESNFKRECAIRDALRREISDSDSITIE